MLAEVEISFITLCKESPAELEGGALETKFYLGLT